MFFFFFIFFFYVLFCALKFIVPYTGIAQVNPLQPTPLLKQISHNQTIFIHVSEVNEESWVKNIVFIFFFFYISKLLLLFLLLLILYFFGVFRFSNKKDNKFFFVYFTVFIFTNLPCMYPPYFLSLLLIRFYNDTVKYFSCDVRCAIENVDSGRMWVTMDGNRSSFFFSDAVLF